MSEMMMDGDFLKEIQEAFLVEAMDLLESNEENFLQLEKCGCDSELISKIFRLAHNLKGTSKAVGLEQFSHFVHIFENMLTKIRSQELEVDGKVTDLLLAVNDRLKVNIKMLHMDLTAPIDNSDLENLILQLLNGGEEGSTADLKVERKEKSVDTKIVAKQRPGRPVKSERGADSPRDEGTQEQYIKVPATKIDYLVDYFGEQVILQSALDFARYDLTGNRDMVAKTILQLNKITGDLQQLVISLRMVNMKTLFTKLERAVRDVARVTNKQIQVIKKGETVELDKNIVEALADPLTHIVRNAVDHGIESREQREQAGKEVVGTVTIHAYRRGGHCFIEVIDDGKGLDKNKILRKAYQKGLISDQQQLSESEIYNLIFASGFSTNEEVTDISGRGVGMDVVKSCVQDLKGSCELATQYGQGSKFIIKIPLTLSVFNGVITEIEHEKFIFANSDVREIVTFTREQVRRVEDEYIVALNDRVFPLIPVRHVLNHALQGESAAQGPVYKQDPFPAERRDYLCLTTLHNNRQYGIVVDDVLSQQRIVHKTLGKEIEGKKAISGGTILSDGRVALILEIGELIDLYKSVMRGDYGTQSTSICTA